MKVRIVILAASAIAFGATGLSAQNFTYDSADATSTAVGGPDMRGHPVVGTHTTGTSTVTWPDGKKTVDKYTCIGTTQPSNNKIFDVHTICDAGNADGTYTAVFGCQYVSKDMLSIGCVGGLTGRTGKYAGKGGTITFGGRSGSGSGTGTWGPASN
jgi:hypothetical protein